MSGFRALPKSFYLRPPDQVAPDLLGRYLIRELEGLRLVARIVETEAYLGAPDRASHAWNGRRTQRNEAMYLRGGHAYVYFVYGMHDCMNVVTGRAGEAQAVLLRAAEAIVGAAVMARERRLRHPPRARELLGGPARLCQGLRIDRSFNALPLWRGELRITQGDPARPRDIVRGPRVGVAYAGEAAAWPLRFAVRGHPEVSRPRTWPRTETRAQGGPDRPGSKAPDRARPRRTR